MGGDLEQSLGGIETLFKDSADIVITNAKKAYMTAGVSANDYMQQVTSFSASLLQSLGGDTEAAAKVADMAVIDMADNANKMGSTVESIQNAYQGFAKQNYTMLDNLKLGYGGTKTEMERLLVDAEKISGIKYDISNLNDVYQAIHVIQGELGITGTTAKEGMETLTGSLTTAKAAMSNFLSGAGGVDDVVNSVSNLSDVVVSRLADLLPRLTTGLTQMAQKLLPKIPELFNALLPAVVEGGSALINGIIETLPALVDTIVGTFPQLSSVILSMLPLMLQAGVDIITSLIIGIGTMMPTLIPTAVETLIMLVQGIIDNLPLIVDTGLQLLEGLAIGIIDSIPVLIAKLPELINSIVSFFTDQYPTIIQTGVDLLTSLIDDFPSIIQTIVGVLPQLINALLNAILGNIPVIIEAGIKLFVALIEALPEIISTIVDALPEIINAILSAIAQNFDKIMEAGEKLFISLIKNLPSIITNIVSAIPKIITSIINGFTDNFPRIVEVGGNLIKGVWQGISDAGAWLRDKISGFFGGVVDSIKNFFGIKSPSKLFAYFGKMNMEGLAKGFEDNVNRVKKSVDSSMNKIFGDIEGKTVDFGINSNINPSNGQSGAMSSISAGQSAPFSYSPTHNFYVNNELDIERVSRAIAKSTDNVLRQRGVVVI